MTNAEKFEKVFGISIDDAEANDCFWTDEYKPTAEPREWISVKDSRKPKIRERVWVTDCDGEVWIMYYNDCDCYFNEFGDVFTEDDIIAWQPITEPSPYKGD